MKSLKTLLKEYEFSQRFEYYDMVYDSLINGNISQAKKLFCSMKREDRKDCYLYFEGYYDSPNQDQRKSLNFFFKLI
jgi:hypothetical protein